MATEVLILEGLALGERARLARQLLHWRQVDLAEIASVTQGQVSAFERNVPVYPAARRRILAALEIDDPYDGGGENHEHD